MSYNDYNYLNNYSGYKYSAPSHQANKHRQSLQNTHMITHAFPSQQNQYSSYSNQAHYPVYSNQIQKPVYSNQTQKPVQRRQSMIQQKSTYQSYPTYHLQSSNTHLQNNAQTQESHQNKSLLAGSGLINASGSAFYDF